MDWKAAGWEASVPDGRYEVIHCPHTQEYEAWYWPAPYAGDDGECVLDFGTLGEAQDACEAHAKARGKLRAV